MKKLIAFLLSFSVFVSVAQQTYQPSTDGVSIGRPIGATNFPTDARSYFRDRTNFTWRPYVSTTEVLTTLNTSAHRKGHFPIIVNTGGTLLNGVITGGSNAMWWFRDGLTNGDLVLINTGGDTTSLSSRIDYAKNRVKVSEYGVTAGSSDSRIGVQNAINAAANFGGEVIFDKPGTYEFSTTSSGGIIRSITMAANVSLLIPPGVTLKLKNSMVSNGAPVQVVHIPTTATNVYVGWPNGKGGTIDGNTSNQPGYTGGFVQTNGNYLIGSANGFNGITIENLNLIRCFSNTINLGGTNTYGNSQNATLKGITSSIFGEGPQIISTDYVIVENCTAFMDGTLVAGDALELSFCRYFTLLGIFSRTTSGANISVGGAGIDMYASRHGSLTNFEVVGCKYGISAETDFSNVANNPDNITISNGTIQFADLVAMTFTGGTISVSNVQALDNVYTGIQVSKYTSNEADYTFENVMFTGQSQLVVTDGCYVRATNVKMYGSGMGFPLSCWSIGTSTFDIDGFTTGPTATNSYIITAVGGVPKGRMINVNAPEGMVPVIPGGEFSVDVEGLMIEGVPGFSTTDGAASAVRGMQIAYSSGQLNSANMPTGTYRQRLEIRGLYGPELFDGARLKLANGTDSVTIPTNEYIMLEYDSTGAGVWRQVGGYIPEVEPQFVATAPYIVYNSIGSNNVLDGNYWLRVGARFMSLDLSTRPAISTALVKGEINGSNWFSDADPSGFLRLSAGGTAGAKTWIDLSGTNGDVDFKNNFLVGVEGVEAFRIDPTNAYINKPLFLNYTLLSNDSSVQAASTKWVKQALAANSNNLYFESGHFWGPGNSTNPVKLKASGVTAGTYAAANITTDSLGRVTAANAGVIAGSYSNAVTTTTTFTVTIGVTMGNNTYKVNVTPTAALSAALFYVTNKTTTTFDVVYLSALTGTCSFDWTVIRQ